MKWTLLLPVLLYIICSCRTARPVVQTPQPAIPHDTIPKTDEKQQGMTKTDAFLEELLQSQGGTFADIISKHDDYRIQVIYTQINRDSANQPSFQTYYYNVDPNRYFYPASTVKLPVALLSLQRLNELKVFGLNSNS